MRYRVTRQARRDLLQIWNYIADDNEDAATRFLELLTQHFRLLGHNPYAGRQRDDLRPGYRSFPVGQYVILYRM
jgi:toxin ParE1/3/4